MKSEGPSAGTLLGVVAHVVIESVKCLENEGKTTAVPSFDIGECHPLITPHVPEEHFPRHIEPQKKEREQLGGHPVKLHTR